MDWKEEHMDDKERGKRIQQLRQEMNLSQEQLVEKLNVTMYIGKRKVKIRLFHIQKKTFLAKCICQKKVMILW